MDKPQTYSEAPEEIREAVERLIETYGSDPGLLAGAIVSSTVRAIIAAKAEEREAVKHWFTCEAEANDELAIQIVDTDGKGWHQHFAEVQRRNVDAINAGRHVEKYAAAIRKRGDVNAAHKISEIED
jgi:hypothetical protein